MDRTRIEDVGDLPEFTMQTRLIDSNNCKAINNAYTELLATYAEETEFAIVRRLRYRQKIEHEKIKQLYELAQEFLDGGQKVRQATGRTFRDGSRSACRFVVPLVAGTVEKEIEQNLERKFRNLASLTDADFRP